MVDEANAEVRVVVAAVGGGSNGASWSGASGSYQSVIQEETTFQLSCTGLDGSSVNESVTANVLPYFQER